MISDIHGNADALAAVMADLRVQGVQAVLNLGDHFSGPLAPAETAELLAGLADHIAIRGNHDRALVHGDPDTISHSDRLALAGLGAGTLDWLRDLPATCLLGDVFLCHGTPGDDSAYWLESVSPAGAVTLASPARISAQCAGIGASLFLCGHSHTPRRVDLGGGRCVLNPGSVGCPGYRHDLPFAHAIQTGSPAARYAVVTRTAQGWASDLRAVPYDARRMARLACKAGQGEWARVVATGWLSG